VDATLMTRVLESPVKDGVTDAGVNEAHEIPGGKGVTHDSMTIWAVPECKVPVITTAP